MRALLVNLNLFISTIYIYIYIYMYYKEIIMGIVQTNVFNHQCMISGWKRGCCGRQRTAAEYRNVHATTSQYGCHRTRR